MARDTLTIGLFFQAHRSAATQRQRTRIAWIERENSVCEVFDVVVAPGTNVQTVGECFVGARNEQRDLVDTTLRRKHSKRIRDADARPERDHGRQNHDGESATRARSVRQTRDRDRLFVWVIEVERG